MLVKLWTILAEKLNANLNNLAVSGATFSKASDNSIFDQALKVKDADLVIVQGTDDDWLKMMVLNLA